MKTKFFLLVIVCSLGVSTVLAYNAPLEKGKQLFSTRCAACHNVNKTLTGPALAGIDQRRSFPWIVRFVRSSQKLVKSGDKDAIAVFEQFNKIPMPDHADLNEEDIRSIVEYITSEAKPALAEEAPFAKPGKLQPNYLPLSIQKDYKFFISYLFIVALLIVVLLFAVNVSDIKHKTLQEKE